LFDEACSAWQLLHSYPDLHAQLARICDVSGTLCAPPRPPLHGRFDALDVGGESFYRLNDDRVLAWLDTKLTRLVCTSPPLEFLKDAMAGQDDCNTKKNKCVALHTNLLLQALMAACFSHVMDLTDPNAFPVERHALVHAYMLLVQCKSIVVAFLLEHLSPEWQQKARDHFK
jgi:hypothetical protein